MKRLFILPIQISGIFVGYWGSACFISGNPSQNKELYFGLSLILFITFIYLYLKPSKNGKS